MPWCRMCQSRRCRRISLFIFCMLLFGIINRNSDCCSSVNLYCSERRKHKCASHSYTWVEKNARVVTPTMASWQTFIEMSSSFFFLLELQHFSLLYIFLFFYFILWTIFHFRFRISKWLSNFIITILCYLGGRSFFLYHLYNTIGYFVDISSPDFVWITLFFCILIWVSLMKNQGKRSYFLLLLFQDCTFYTHNFFCLLLHYCKLFCIQPQFILWVRFPAYDRANAMIVNSEKQTENSIWKTNNNK